MLRYRSNGPMASSLAIYCGHRNGRGSTRGSHADIGIRASFVSRCRGERSNQGFSIGASLSGMIAGSVIPKLGWEAMLVLAGILPLLVAAFAFFYLMESLDFMIRRKWKAQKISRVLERIEKGSAFMTQHLVFAEQQRTARRRGSLAGISGLFKHQFLPATLLLWALYFLGLLVYYFFSGWLPAITRDAGFSTTEGSWITALFPLGGAVGAVVIGYLLDKTRPRFVIGASYALSGIFIFLIGLVSTKALFLTPLVFLGGATLVGATFSLPAVAAGSYPTLIRATGVAWMLGVGRLGGITGSMVGGKLLSLHWLAEQIFQAASVPAFLAAALILCAASALPYGKDIASSEQLDQIAINPHASGSQPVK
jgi:AAHS family 4-hydroxybenzoate transporter-like MFS transporter